MGQAKQRGTYEERKAQAEARNAEIKKHCGEEVNTARILTRLFSHKPISRFDGMILAHSKKVSVNGGVVTIRKEEIAEVDNNNERAEV